MPLRIDIKAGERFVLNNTVMYLTRSAGIIIEGKATFLLDRDCIHAEEVGTAAQRVHYLCQQMYLHEDRAASYRPQFLEACAAVAENLPALRPFIDEIGNLVGRSEFFRALKLARQLAQREAASLRQADENRNHGMAPYRVIAVLKKT